MALLMVLASAAGHNLFPPMLSPAMYQQSEPWAFQEACPLSPPRPSPCSASYLGFALSLTCPPASSRLREPAVLLRSACCAVRLQSSCNLSWSLLVERRLGWRGSGLGCWSRRAGLVSVGG